MKVNVHDSPDAWKHRIYLDGVLVQYAIEADDEAGYVLVAKQHDGKIVYEDDRSTPITLRREGVVRIEPFEKHS